MDRRGPFKKMLDQVCDIYRSPSTLNSWHEVVSTETLLEAGVICMMAFPSGRKVILPIGIDPAKIRLFYFEWDQDVQERDIIVFNSRRYVVNSVDVTPKMHHKEAMCETLLGG